MPELRACSLGWDLDHPQIEPRALTDVEAWNRAAVVFLSLGAVEQLWQRAVGDPIRVFRSRQLERDCWQALLTLGGQIRALLQRGGYLICRIDLPHSRCRVSDPPGVPEFPPGNQLNHFDALATVNADFAAVARVCGRLPQARLNCVPAGHPLDAYIEAYQRHFACDVALSELPPGFSPLAATPKGHCLAAVRGNLAWLPALKTPDPFGEGPLLAAAARRLLGLDITTTPALRDPAACLLTIQQREQQLAARIAELSSQRDALAAERQARAWLWKQLDLPHITEREETLRQIFALLHLDPVAQERLQVVDRTELVSWEKAQSQIPLGELRQAIAAVLMHPVSELAAQRLRQALADSPPAWRFEPRDVLLEEEEIAELGVTR